MTNEPSPRPWRVSASYADRYSTGHRDIVDAKGELVAVRVSAAAAALIVDAVNRFLHGEDAPLTPCHSGRDGQFRGVPDRQDGNTRTSGDGTERRASLLLPWTVEGPFTGLKPTRKRDGFSAYSNIVNRVGVYVAQNLQPEVAAPIVDAVNKRDRLRDLVRRLARVAQDTLDFAEAMSGIIPDHPERAKARSEIEAMLLEAREAIGESKE